MISEFKRRFGRQTTCIAFIRVSFLLLAIASVAKDGSDAHLDADSQKSSPILWSNPSDIASRDLFYGSGGKHDEPHTTFTFVSEDRKGSNPKFDVRDEDGTKWKVKLGLEVKPEIAATRLLWAVGYFTDEDYFLPVLRVENMPRLKRGQKLVDPDGTMHDVRLKRQQKSAKKTGNWEWSHNPFTGTRELNGLRVMMALMNSWDLKTENNAVYEERDDTQDAPLHYIVSDLGASFGTAGITLPLRNAKGNPREYSRSKFIKRFDEQYVDFNVPARPSLWFLGWPNRFALRMHIRWIGHHIPRTDVRWMGQLLSQLSKDQIRDAFRAAGYTPQEAEEFANVVEKRIRELNQL